MRYVVMMFLSLLSLVGAGTVRVALAANVSYAMPALKKDFALQYPGVIIQSIVGGSGKLTTQIRSGAPYDLFLSANMAYPQQLFELGITVDKPVTYAQGALAILSNVPRDFSRGIALLEESFIRSVAVANPKTAPYGKAAFDVLHKAGLFETVHPKLVFGESIAQTVAYVSHVADIGLVAKSALFAPQMKEYKPGTNWVDVNPALYHPIDQGMVLLKNAPNLKEAEAFYVFLLSRRAREIFIRHGYRVP